MKKIFVTSVIAILLASGSRAHAQYAGAVVDYTSGTLLNSDPFTSAPYNNPNVVLGAPNGIIGSDTPFPGVYSPFNPPFEASSLTGIGAGGQLTLQLQNYVTVSPGAYEIGVWSNVGVVDVNYPNGQMGATAATFSTPASAVVSVSADGTTWVTLNGGAPVTFGNPGNYYVNAGPYDTAAPASPVLSDFGKPFAGTLADFNGETYAQMLLTLNGAAGGTWLNLDSTGLDKVGYIRFNGVEGDTELDLSTISINSALAAEPVPEPGTYALFAIGAVALVVRFKRRQAGAER